MDITLYKKRCLEIRDRFGEEKYSKEHLNAAWQYWKEKDNESFEAFVAKIIVLPWPTKLIPVVEIPIESEYECPQEAIGAKPKQVVGDDRDALMRRLSAKLNELGASSIADIIGNREKVNSLIKMF